MDIAYVIIFILTSLIVIVQILVKRFYIQPGAHFAVINIVSLYFYLYAITFSLSDKIINVNGLWNLEFKSHVLIFYTVIVIISYFSMEKKNKKKNPLIAFKKRNNVKLNKSKLQKVTLGITFTSIVLILSHILSINQDLFWLNTQYLLIVNPNRLGIDSPLIALFHRLIPIFGIVSFSLFALLLKYKKDFVSLLVLVFSLVPCIYFLLFELAANSRSTCLMLAIPALILFSNKTKAYSYLFITLCFICYNAVLFGRSQVLQGFSQIINNLVLSITNFDEALGLLVSNLFAGASNLAVCIDIETYYPEVYKIFSFSPLFSYLDGFDTLKKLHYVGLNSYIPYSTYSELYHFGYVYIIFFCIVLFFVLKKLNQIINEYSLLGYLICSPAYIAFFAMQQYPVRSYFRYLLLPILIYYLIYWVYKKYNYREVVIT